MGQPFPPQGAQHQVTERPRRVFAEQYLIGQPLPVGAVIIPELFGETPQVFTETKRYDLLATEWVITNRYSGKAVEVISAEEYAERFGPGGAP